MGISPFVCKARLNKHARNLGLRLWHAKRGLAGVTKARGPRLVGVGEWRLTGKRSST